VYTVEEQHDWIRGNGHVCIYENKLLAVQKIIVSKIFDQKIRRFAIKVFYNEIVQSLTGIYKLFIPRIAWSALKHYWSIALDELKENSMAAHTFGVQPVVLDLMKFMKLSSN